MPGGGVDEGSPIKGLLNLRPHLKGNFPNLLADLLETLPPSSPLQPSALVLPTHTHMDPTFRLSASQQDISEGTSSFQGFAKPSQRQHMLSEPPASKQTPVKSPKAEAIPVPARAEAWSPTLVAPQHSPSPASCTSPKGNSSDGLATTRAFTPLPPYARMMWAGLRDPPPSSASPDS